MDKRDLELFANEIRKNVVTSIHNKGGGHIGGSLSMVDLIAVLYGGVMRVNPEEPNWVDRDFLICSKGHCAPAIYAALAIKGFFPVSWLDELNRGGTRLPGHSDRIKVPGIDSTTGSLGQGLSIACGLAHSIKLANANQYVYCITGDGENDEGQIWEAAMYAANHELDHLIMFVDWNKKQIDGLNDKVMKLFDLEAKYREFGWFCQKIDGNSVCDIQKAIEIAKLNNAGRPSMILMDTVKGAGVPSIEMIDDNHCIGVSRQLADKCIDELKLARELI